MPSGLRITVSKLGKDNEYSISVNTTKDITIAEYTELITLLKLRIDEVSVIGMQDLHKNRKGAQRG